MGKKSMESAMLEIVQSISEMFDDQDLATQFRELAQKGLVNVEEEKAVEALGTAENSTKD